MYVTLSARQLKFGTSWSDQNQKHLKCDLI